MASPRRRRLKKLLRLAAIKAQKAVETVVEKALPKEEDNLVVEKPVVKEEAPKKAAPKKAAPKKEAKKNK